MTDETTERMIEAAQDYNDPPEAPTEEMWAVIREQLPAAGRAGGADATDELAERRGRMSWQPRSWVPWAAGLAAAATLAVGFGLGRVTRAPDAPVAVADASETRSPAVRLAAAEHLGNAEALLTLFGAGPAASGDREVTADWARDLLATTRLLLDSRVAEDPQMAALLNELELVLVQIAHASADGDQELIEEGIRDQQLMTRLRVAQAPTDISL